MSLRLSAGLSLFGLASFWYAGSLLGGDSLGAALERSHVQPIDGAERVEYRASWSGIPVASAEVRAAPLVINGERFYHVHVQASTWRYLELIWKMRDSIESLFEAETSHPHRFIFRQRENRKITDTTAAFDPSTSKWVVHRQRGNKIRDYEFTSRNTMDPISAVYLARRMDFRIGDSLRLEVFGGRSRYLVILDIVGQERVTVKAGAFDAYKINPRIINLSRSGYAGRVRQATLWISADEKRRPLKVVSEVFIGSVSIEMVEAKSLHTENSGG